MPPTWPLTTILNMRTWPGTRRRTASVPSGIEKNWSVKTLRTAQNRLRKSYRGGSTVPAIAKTSWTPGSPRWASLMRRVRLPGAVYTGFNCWPLLAPSRGRVRGAGPLERTITLAVKRGPKSMESMSRRAFFAITTACTAAAALAAVPPSKSAAIHSEPSAAPPAPLRRFIAEYMRALNAPGLTLALANVQGPVSIAAFGLADLDAKTPVTTLHRFEIGSITKSFAAIVILQLQDEGKLDVQHPILRYLPWLPIDTDFGEIRIHHLLTHSAGTPASDGHLLPAEAGARLRQAFQPGTQFHYCNWGFGVLGRLIESIDGVPW